MSTDASALSCPMNNIRPLSIADRSMSYTEDSMRFLNLTLDKDRIKYFFDPIIDAMSKNIEFSFKSPAKIQLISTAPTKYQQLINCLQFDDICIRLFHLDSSKDFFVIFQSQFARTLLMRLLSTSLVNEKSSLLFSSTEKGVFSFIIARLLVEMKKMLGHKMPNLKLLGIFHAADESMAEFQVHNYGSCNFMVNFSGLEFPVAIFCPTEIFEISFDHPTDRARLFARCGHIKQHLSFRVHRLKMHIDTLYRLEFGDLILFDHADLSWHEDKLSGKLAANWRGIWLDGTLGADHGQYNFTLFHSSGRLNGVDEMEELEISGAKPKCHDDNYVFELAKNLRVEISIELSRIPMSLREICDLKSGEIIDLHRKIDDPLEIVLEGKVIGYCTPVQIDGRLGIRILSIENAQESQQKL